MQGLQIAEGQHFAKQSSDYCLGLIADGLPKNVLYTIYLLNSHPLCPLI